MGKENGAAEHVHESPLVMTIPLMVLALFSVVAGLVGIPGQEVNISKFIFFVEAGAASAAGSGESMNMYIAMTSSLIALAGIALAFIIYAFKLIKARELKRISGPVYTLVKNKYYIDEIYMFFIKNVFFVISAAIKWFDKKVVDGIVNLIAFLSRWAGDKLRRTTTGSLQTYALIIFSGLIGVIVIVAIVHPEMLKLLGGR
jgi:NADH-quinone oxidoreductase subunit L